MYSPPAGQYFYMFIKKCKIFWFHVIAYVAYYGKQLTDSLQYDEMSAMFLPDNKSHSSRQGLYCTKI